MSRNSVKNKNAQEHMRHVPNFKEPLPQVETHSEVVQEQPTVQETKAVVVTPLKQKAKTAPKKKKAFRLRKGKENRRDRFIRLATVRTTKALNSIRLLGNLSRRTNYDYTEEDISRIQYAVEAQLNDVLDKFQDSIIDHRKLRHNAATVVQLRQSVSDTAATA